MTNVLKDNYQSKTMCRKKDMDIVHTLKYADPETVFQDREPSLWNFANGMKNFIENLTIA